MGGEAQIKRGESTAISDEQELHEFFEDIKTRNREKKA